VKWSAEDVTLVPPAVVTVMSTVPIDPAGDVATIWVAVFETIEAAAPPKWTDVALFRPVPVIVTDVPPATGPAAGETEVTVGAGTESAIR